jgi:hypothetical protein
MSIIHSSLFYLHILFGSMALLLFWVPLVSKKGGLDHRKFGFYYTTTMYVVAATGALMAVLVISAPLVIKQHFINENTNTELLALRLRVFWSFLLYLSLLTFVSLRHGQLALKHKKQHHKMRDWPHLLSIGMLFLGGLALAAAGFVYSNTLHVVFGILGTVSALQTGHYCLVKQVSAHKWLMEHFSSMIGSGIGAYTAFIAFGGRTLLSEFGSIQILFWIAPGVVGTIAITKLSRKYKDGLVTTKKVPVEI